MSKLLIKGFWGIALGFVVSRIGFVDFNEVHNMFLMTDPRMFLSFASGAALVVFYFLVVQGFKVEQDSGFTPGTIPGSTLFGTGWALTGGCPAIVMVQFSHGYGAAIFTFIGVSAGMILYRYVHRRYFGWASASCEA